jgi:hypothetical protein
MTACTTIRTANVTCFKQPYKLFPWSFQESPGKCFFDNCQPKTSHHDDGLRQAYLFISPTVRKEDLAGVSGHVRERIQDVCQLAWVNVRRFCDRSVATEVMTV